MSTFGIGILGVAGIAACLYMAEHGYEWWQIGLMALFALALKPRFRISISEEDE